MISKRGQFIEGLLFTISLFIIAVIFLSMAYIFPKIAMGLNQTGVVNTTEEQAAVTNLYEMSTSGINQGFLIFFGGLILLQIVSVFIVRYHPVYMTIFIAMIVVNAFIAIYIGNTFETFIENPEFVATMETQPVMEFVMTHLLAIVIIVDVLTMFILFAKVGEAPI